MERVSAYKHYINTNKAPPINLPPYRLPIEKRKEIQIQVDKMLTKNIIEASFSPDASPVVLVKKPNEKWRFCVDYRRLNEETVRDSYHLPNI